MRIWIFSPLVAILILSAPAFADEDQKASSDETTKVSQTLAKIGCKAVDVEKEAAQLYEVDDAECAIGQYDIKLDGDFNIISLTKDY